MRRLLPLALLAMSAPAHAAWLHACPGADGGPTRHVVNDQPRMTGCASAALTPGAQAETIHPLAPGENPEATILLHGNLEQGRFAIGEVELPPLQPPPAQPAPMPLRSNLLEGMRARVFGVEERVTARLDGGRLEIACRAGSRPAGVILTGPWYLPRAGVALAANLGGAANGFTWQAADQARAERDGALDMTAQATAGGKLRLTLPANLERGAWRQFVILCPGRQASLRLDSLALEPVGAPKAAPRSTWVWRPGDWIDSGPALLDWAAAQGIQELFVTVPLDGGAVRAPELLAAFVRQAGARGIGIHSVDGDPGMALAGEVPAAVARVRAYAAYNAAAAPEARLRGIQFDVEPYLLPESVLPAAERDARYLAMARALKAAAGPLRLEFVVPFWWAGKPGLLDALAPSADALAVMNYRTDPGQVYAFAAPFLDWAARHGRQVRVALEAGPIAPETQRRYVRAAPGEPGELQLLEVGGRQVLVLLRAPVAPSSQTAPQLYRLQSSRVSDGSATTFHRDKPALLRLLPRLEADFGAWDSFGGIAVHELR